MSADKPRVLVVDDEEGMRTALVEVLARRSFEIDCASNAIDAMSRIEQSPYSLVISDVRMPGMTGLELLSQTKAKRPDTPFVMMTAFGSIEDAVEAMKMGAYDYLIKPFSSETVDAVVSGALNGPRTGAPEPAPVSKARRSAKKEMIAIDPSMKRLLKMTDEVAGGRATVLIQGESGVGKEVLAREIHRRGPRSAQAFVAVNCAALPEGLLESELFGHEKGSFTGAILSRKGKFEQANGGTILLDEISEMPVSLQAKLLRVLQEHEIEPIGSTRPVSLDIRVIATTNRVLTEWVKQGNFREDLFYRLNVIVMEIPPLRNRRGDIIALAEHFLDKHCRRNERPMKRMNSALRAYLLGHEWAGNVRELENFVERAVLLCRGDEITPESLYLDPAAEGQIGGESAAGSEEAETIGAEPITLEQMEKRMIIQTLERVEGNRTRAAEQLGVSVRTIRNKLHQYGLQGA